MILKNIEEFAEFYKTIEFGNSGNYIALCLRLPIIGKAEEYDDLISKCLDHLKVVPGVNRCFSNRNETHAQIFGIFSGISFEEVIMNFTTVGPALVDIVSPVERLVVSSENKFDRVTLTPISAETKEGLFYKISLILFTPFYNALSEIKIAFDQHKGKFNAVMIVDFSFTFPWTKYDEIEFLINFTEAPSISPVYVESYPGRSTLCLLCRDGAENHIEAFVDEMIRVRGETHNSYIGKNKDAIEVTIHELIDCDEFNVLSVLDEDDKPTVIMARIEEYINEGKKKAN